LVLQISRMTLSPLRILKNIVNGIRYLVQEVAETTLIKKSSILQRLKMPKLWVLHFVASLFQTNNSERKKYEKS